MIHSIADKLTRDVLDGINSKASRGLPLELHPKARRLMDFINAAGNINDLRVPPGNHLEALKGDRRGFYSVRINDQWLITFRWVESDAEEVRIVDCH
jgi:proteic killer suppression protein